MSFLLDLSFDLKNKIKNLYKRSLFDYIVSAIIIIQSILLISFSFKQFCRFNLTHDFSIFSQAYYLIGHGDFNPFDTLQGFPYYQNHFELIMWPIAILFSPFNSSFILLIIQDISIILSEIVILVWVKQISDDNLFVRFLTLIILICNPGLYWGAAWDFHFESLATFFLCVSLYSLYKDRTKSVIVFSFLTLLCGDVSATYVIGAGITSLILRKNWKVGLTQIVMGLFLLVIVHLLDANKGDAISGSYGYLDPGRVNNLFSLFIAVITHPLIVGRVFIDRFKDIYANISLIGFLGLFSLWSLPTIITVLLPSALASYIALIVPGFQSTPMYFVGTLGTIYILMWLKQKVNYKFFWIVSMLLLINSIGWGIVWLPKLDTTWIRNDDRDAKVLNLIDTIVPKKDELIVQNGVSGRFASRPYFYTYQGASKISLRQGNNYFIFAPYTGIEGSSTIKVDQVENLLVKKFGAKILFIKNGIILLDLFSLNKKIIYLNGSSASIPVWTLRSEEGHFSFNSNKKSITLFSGVHSGYLLYGDYWNLLYGKEYIYHIKIKDLKGAAVVQLWDTSSNKLLEVRTIIPMPSFQNLKFKFFFNSSDYIRPYVFQGWGPFSDIPLQPTSKDSIEVRIWVPQYSDVSISSISMS
ncbi:DUF2079 domain-containing protein [Sulfoacidibacillus ferrooxidans]|uniref:Uncharacterized protein n=1 Tax=Sulfoacidibacillus ferrooxidans TaxID=2005001 RepID=A0A9X1V921_9BACL|nr:DUF2079 domain-containing protein [Sulfoacidibacillus ferrooxidans]MCI0183407.1 hypothetical protein [Sulfoacidibacillus ferrooxidans]